MDIKKTLRYNWEFGRETVAIRVSSYRNNGNLYVGLCHNQTGGAVAETAGKKETSGCCPMR